MHSVQMDSQELTTKTMTIRFAIQNDFDVLIELCTALFYESRFRDKAINLNKIKEVAKGALADPAQNCVIVACNAAGEIVGLLAGVVTEYFFCDGLMAQDRCFYVKPAYRGSDAAPKLILGFRAWALQRGAMELCIYQSVGIEQQRFDHFMNKMGFANCGSNFSLQL